VNNSSIAFEKSKLTGPEKRSRVYLFLLSKGEHGATDDEVINAGLIPHQSMGGTRLELMRLGALVKTGVKRETVTGSPASVYRAVPGVDVLQAPPKTERDRLLTAARKKVKEMTLSELRSFVGTPEKKTSTRQDYTYDESEFLYSFLE
jgi:hypothetical protein